MGCLLLFTLETHFDLLQGIKIIKIACMSHLKIYALKMALCNSSSWVFGGSWGRRRMVLGSGTVCTDVAAKHTNIYIYRLTNSAKGAAAK